MDQCRARDQLARIFRLDLPRVACRMVRAHPRDRGSTVRLWFGQPRYRGEPTVVQNSCNNLDPVLKEPGHQPVARFAAYLANQLWSADLQVRRKTRPAVKIPSSEVRNTRAFLFGCLNHRRID